MSSWYGNGWFPVRNCQNLWLFLILFDVESQEKSQCCTMILRACCRGKGSWTWVKLWDTRRIPYEKGPDPYHRGHAPSGSCLHPKTARTFGAVAVLALAVALPPFGRTLGSASRRDVKTDRRMRASFETSLMLWVLDALEKVPGNYSGFWNFFIWNFIFTRKKKVLEKSFQRFAMWSMIAWMITLW